MLIADAMDVENSEEDNSGVQKGTKEEQRPNL